MKFLFWNINKKENIQHIYDLVFFYNIDVLLLAESRLRDIELLSKLNNRFPSFYFYNLGKNTKIKMFGKYPPQISKLILDEERKVAVEFNIPLFGKINIIAAHFQSKNNWESSDQYAHVSSINQFIGFVEKMTGHSNTILVGDFNMNPFEYGMVQTTGIHSVMDRRIALKMSRRVEGQEYKFFYNPMWNFFGDNKEICGTHYFHSAKPISYFWNILDQVLIRPGLINIFDMDFLDIVVSTGKTDLLSSKGNIKNHISDHLPIKFSLKI